MNIFHMNQTWSSYPESTVIFALNAILNTISTFQNHIEVHSPTSTPTAIAWSEAMITFMNMDYCLKCNWIINYKNWIICYSCSPIFMSSGYWLKPIYYICNKLNLFPYVWSLFPSSEPILFSITCNKSPMENQSSP